MAETVKHYMVRGCNRKIIIDDMLFPFEPYALIGGQWFGMYSTEAKEEQDILDKADWIHGLSEEQRQEELKKKAGSFSEYRPLPGNQHPHSPRPGDAPAAPRETESMAEEAKEPEDLDLNEIIKPSPVKKAKAKAAKEAK